jgi:hypothetical protein
MKKLLLLLFSFAFLLTNAQDYCTPAKKLMSAALSDFNGMMNPNRRSLDDETQYEVDLTFNPGVYGLVIKKAGQEPFFTQAVNAAAKYEEIFTSIITCLMFPDAEDWNSTTLSNGVMYANKKTGFTIQIVTSGGWTHILGFINKELLKPVFTENFCADLNNVVSAFDNGFKYLKGNIIDSIKGEKKYKSTLKLNQRFTTTCYIKEKRDTVLEISEYTFCDFVMEDQMNNTDVMLAFDKCLTKEKGWTKEKIIYADGAFYKKGKISICLYQNRGTPGQPGNSLIDITKIK